MRDHLPDAGKMIGFDALLDFAFAENARADEAYAAGDLAAAKALLASASQACKAAKEAALSSPSTKGE